MNKKLLTSLIACGAIFLLFTPVLAIQEAPTEQAPVTIENEEEIDLDTGEEIDQEVNLVITEEDPYADMTHHYGTYFSADENIVLNDYYHSDVIVAGQSITLSSDTVIEGDLIVAGQNLTIQGDIRGDLRAAGSQINLINNFVAGTATLFASQINADQNTVINKDATIYAQNINFAGIINGNLWTGAEQSNINEEMVQGNIYYPEESAPKINLESDPLITISSVIWAIFKLIGLLLIGLVIIYLFPKKCQDTVKTMFDQPGKSLLKGLLWVLITPIVLALIMVTIIGIPFSIIGFVLYGLAIYLSTLLVGLALGDRMIPKSKSLLWPLALGTTVFYLATLVPYAGGALSFLGTLWAIGAFSLNCKCNKKSKKVKK